jgi:hypothetical protein
MSAFIYFRVVLVHRQFRYLARNSRLWFGSVSGEPRPPLVASRVVILAGKWALMRFPLGANTSSAALYFPLATARYSIERVPMEQV